MTRYFALVFLLGVVSFATGCGANSPATSAVSTLSPEDITATLCAEGSAQPVMAWVLFGTPTRTATPPGGVAPSPTPPAGSVEDGKTLFNTTAACSTCHSTTPGEWLVGPSLAGIATRAGEKRAGLSAQDYLRGVIYSPDENVIPQAIPGIMPRTYSSTLSQEQIEDIVAYLMTLN